MDVPHNPEVMIMKTSQLPCNEEDRITFKQMAAQKNVTMVDLFHEWIEYHKKVEKFVNREMIEK